MNGKLHGDGTVKFPCPHTKKEQCQVVCEICKKEVQQEERDDGGVLEGKFKNGKLVGKATIKFENGDQIVGVGRGKRLIGKGIRHYKNGNVYEGEFWDHIRWGKGTMHYNNNSTYEGHWAKGELSQEGKFTHGWGPYDGNTEEGKWKGKFKQGNFTLKNAKTGKSSFANYPTLTRI